MSIVCSLDAITPSTYGGIRIGADLEPVLANVERFQRATQEQGTTFSINHCLMVQNHHEFADLLLWAEERGIHVDVSVVRAPSDCSLADLPVGELRSVHDLMSGRDDEVRPQLVRNARTWATEVARIGGWADEAERRGTGPGVRRRVLVFSVDGDGPHDDGAARRDLAAFAADGVAHVLTVDLDGVIVECSPSLDAAHGPVTSRVLGRHFDAVQDLSIELFGPLVRFREVSAGPDRFDAEARYGATDVRVAMVAVRDAQGQARHGTIVVAFRPSPPD